MGTRREEEGEHDSQLHEVERLLNRRLVRVRRPQLPSAVTVEGPHAAVASADDAAVVDACLRLRIRRTGWRRRPNTTPPPHAAAPPSPPPMLICYPRWCF